MWQRTRVVAFDADARRWGRRALGGELFKKLSQDANILISILQK